jgi:nicotinate-nucleotide adenylyltransferase
MKKIAVFGGTFDPLHIGHLILAQFIINNGYAEKILFIPSFNPPHKQNNKVSDFMHRYNMIKLETDKDSDLEVSDIEKYMDTPSYTYNTIKRLCEINKDVSYSLIIGQDQYNEFHTWYRYEDIIKEFNIIVFKRNFANISVTEKIDIKNFTFLNNDIIPVSSTEIRKNIRNRKKFRYTVTEDIWKYIMQNDIYCSKECSNVS